MASDATVYPSTLRYKDRLAMEGADSIAYTRLYSSEGSDVWARLTGDAKVRQTSARSVGAFKEGGAQVTYSFKNSGFDSNTCPPIFTTTTAKAGHYTHGTPIEQLHVITARQIKTKQPLEFLTQIRPDTETTSQAMRMLGTYDSDKAHADRLGVFIPSGCPGGRPAYHPDVTTGGFGLMPTLPRKGLGNTLYDGRNLK